MASTRPITIHGGRPYSHELTVTNPDGSPFTFGGADTFLAQVRSHPSATDAITFTVERDGNVLVASLSGAQTDAVARDSVWEWTWTPGGDGDPVPLIEISPVEWKKAVAR